jgi:hypothetical protein
MRWADAAVLAAISVVVVSSVGLLQVANAASPR